MIGCVDLDVQEFETSFFNKLFYFVKDAENQIIHNSRSLKRVKSERKKMLTFSARTDVSLISYFSWCFFCSIILENHLRNESGY